MLTNDQHAKTLSLILDHPEAALEEYGKEGSLDLIRELSEYPDAAAALKECELVKLIESGKKYVRGAII